MVPFLDSWRGDSSGVVSAVDSILSSNAATENGSHGLSFDILLAAGDCDVETENLMAFSKVVSSTLSHLWCSSGRSLSQELDLHVCQQEQLLFSIHYKLAVLPFLDEKPCTLKNQQGSFLYYWNLILCSP